MEPGVGYTKLQSSPILNHYNMHLGIERIKKGHLGLFGFQELMQVQENLVFPIQILLDKLFFLSNRCLP